MPGRLTPPIPARLGPQCAKQRVDERAVRVAGRRMHDHAGRLVDDDQMRILEADVERDRLRRRLGGFGFGHGHDKILRRPDPLRRVAQHAAPSCVQGRAGSAA